jgi:Berberine and berberine like
VAEFYSASSGTIPPLPWQTFPPPFSRDWQKSFWGSNYPRLRQIKDKYDPDGLFVVHHGVGSEDWSADGFEKLSAK